MLNDEKGQKMREKTKYKYILEKQIKGMRCILTGGNGMLISAAA